jgi:hypothetical protein
MYKKYIFLSVSLVCINTQAMFLTEHEKQTESAEEQLLFLTLHPQEIAHERRFLETYDIRNARRAAKLIHDGVKVDCLPLLRKIEQNRYTLPNTYAVIIAGKVVQSWNPPISKRPDGSTYSYRELALTEFKEVSKLGDTSASLKYASKFVDAICKLREFSDQSFERYLSNEPTVQSEVVSARH